MAYGLTPNAQSSYVLECDQDLPETDPTRSVFHYRNGTAPERAKLEDLSGGYDAKSGTVEMRMGTSNYMTLRAFLTGWDNYLDEEGRPIPFETEGKQLNVLGRNVDPPSDATLGRLHPDHSRELAQAIRDGQRLSRTQVKNSTSPPE